VMFQTELLQVLVLYQHGLRINRSTDRSVFMIVRLICLFMSQMCVPSMSTIIVQIM
jgi:hypothetical protein